MKRVAFVLLGLVAIAAGVALLVGRLAPAERVYSPDEIAAGLRRQPRAWIGRTVLVRGVVIAYAYYLHGPGGSNAGGQYGCYFHDPACARATWASLAMAPSGGVVHVVLAARVHYFAFQGNVGQITPQHPANTLSVAFRAPLSSDTLPPLLRPLRRWPAIGPVLPPAPSGVDGSGLYRIRIVDDRARKRDRAWQVDGVLL